jgi:molybdopterin molybdotransferase
MSEPDVSDLISVQQAIEILDAVTVHPRVRRVKLAHADGMILARDVVCDRDYPSFEKSMMDGFAIRSSDASLELKLVGEIPAGQMPTRELRVGETMAIMTGAPLPPGADAVVPIEFARRANELVRISKPTDFKRFVARKGSDCHAGTIVLNRGMKLEAPQLAAAATVGASEVDVYEPPRVAILATGDELVPFDRSPEPQQIRNSNTIMLASLLTRAGCSVTDLGIVRDDMPALLAAIEHGLQDDAFFITGGMSVGAYDLPPKALAQLGADIRITKLKIKPGKPFIYAQLRGGHIFGLPGNPLAGFVCTVRLASRLLRRMIGLEASSGQIPATLASELPANGPREFYQPAMLQGSVAHPLNWKSSADVFTLARANALLIRVESEPAKPAGAPCTLLPV